MEPEEFRRQGRALIDWIADYLEGAERYPVLAQVAPGEIRDRLPAHPPEQPEPFEAMLRDVDEIVLPGITHWQSPNFFAFFPGSNSYPSILGELLSAGLGVQGMLWATSPACTEVETVVLDWLAELLDLPAAFRGNGVIADSASSATLCALVAARERAGPPYADLVAYASTQAHSSVDKGARIAGVTLRHVDVDSSFAMRPDALKAAIAADRARGLRPFFVAATVGTTSSLAMDPLRAHDGLWLHVDAAMAGVAAMCPEFRAMHDGLEVADSYCTNPHKWLLTNFDCSAFYVADRDALTTALSVVPEYLRNRRSEAGEVVDYRDWQIPLGRRFRALKLWFVLRSFGAAGLRAHLRGHVALASGFAARVTADPRFALTAPPRLNLVCFHHVDGEAATQRILDEINTSGAAYLTHTRLGGVLSIRVCIGQSRTRQPHVDALWALVDSASGETGRGSP